MFCYLKGPGQERFVSRFCLFLVCALAELEMRSGSGCLVDGHCVNLRYVFCPFFQSLVISSARQARLSKTFIS